MMSRPLLARLYSEYLSTRDTASFIHQVSRHYAVGTIERLTLHPRRDARRGAVLALSFLGTYESNGVMGRALSDTDRTVRLLAENGIRNLWLRVGDESHRQRIGVVVQLNLSQQWEESVRTCTELLEEVPWFAEVWNQRAIAQYHIGRYLDSITDCNQALEINPYHFGAAAGMGQGYLQLGNRRCALESFRRALRLNPNLESMRAGIAYLERLLKKKSS